MTNTKITKRDNFNALRTMVETSSLTNDEQNSLLTFIDHEIELLDKRAESSSKYKAKAKSAKTDLLAEMIVNALVGVDAYMTIPQIVEAIGEAATPQKVAYRLGKMVDSGTVIKDSVSIKEEGQSSRRICTYRYNHQEVAPATDSDPDLDVE